MRTIKYVLLALLIILLLAFIPWIDGELFKRNYLALLAHNKKYVRVLEYHQGWLTSRAKIQVIPITLTASEFIPVQAISNKNNTVSVGMVIEQDIVHGPIVYDYSRLGWRLAQAAMASRIHLPPVIEMVLLDGQQSQGVMQVNTLATLKNSFQNHIEIPALKIQIPGILSVSWAGLLGDVHLNFTKGRVTQIKSNFNVGSILIQNAKGAITIQPIAINEQFDLHSGGLWNGRYTFIAQAASINQSDFSASMNDFNLQSTFGVDTENLYSNALDISIGKIILQENEIHPISIKLLANYFNSKVLFNMVDSSSSMLKDYKNSPEQVDKYSALMAQLITPKTNLAVDVAFNSTFGNLNANAQVSWPVNTPLPISMEDVPGKVNFEVNARISNSLMNLLIDLAAKKQAANYTESKVSNASSTPAKETPEEHIKRLSNEGKIPLDVAIQLQDLVNSKLTVEIYAGNVDRYVVTKEITANTAAELKAKYMEFLASSTADVSPAPTTPVVTAEQVQQKVIQESNQQIHELITKGYLIQAQGEYVFSAKREQGVLTVNGKNAASLPHLDITMQ